MALSGVRTSWLMFWINAVFRLLAFSAITLAFLRERMLRLIVKKTKHARPRSSRRAVQVICVLYSCHIVFGAPTTLASVGMRDVSSLKCSMAL